MKKSKRPNGIVLGWFYQTSEVVPGQLLVNGSYVPPHLIPVNTKPYRRYPAQYGRKLARELERKGLLA